MQHHRGILADGIEHHWVLEPGGDLAHDEDALSLQPLQVSRQGFLAGRARLETRCIGRKVLFQRQRLVVLMGPSARGEGPT